jgi:nitrate/TMAO reductase-like tetraheme cytochrome c subunit
MSDIAAPSPSRQPGVTRAVHWALERWRMAGIMVGSAAFGLAVSTTWTKAIEFTGHCAFCITCQVMKDTRFDQYQGSKHLKNMFGVHAGCLDCHVTQYSWLAEGEPTFGTIGGLYGFFFGGTSNVASLEKRRPRPAKDVRGRFAATHVQECRHCHDYSNMALDEQKPEASSMHRTAMTTDRTCVACHQEMSHRNDAGEVAVPAPTSFDMK